MSSLPSADMAAFKELLSSSKHIIAVAGAGLSAASGEFPRVRLGRAPRALVFFFGFQVSQHSEDLGVCGANMTQ